MRPLATSDAVSILPVLIYDMMTRKTDVTVHSAVGPARVITLYNPAQPKNIFSMLQSDFDVCKKIMTTVPLRVFPTDGRDEAIARIKAHVTLEFANRP